jgi:pimeloyl-ACP methyl ester carboxylesterase
MMNRRETLGMAAMLGTLGALPAQAQAPNGALPYRAHRVVSGDGTGIAVYDYGNPEGRPVLLIHGYAQSAISWARQTNDRALLDTHRLVAMDLRGHCMSDKPEGDAFYRESQRWAEDVKAVMDALSLRRPVLVGWSYGGRVIGDYLAAHGPGNVGAVNFVCAVGSGDPALFGAGARFIAQMTSADPLTAIRGTHDFLRACFEVQPHPGDLLTMMAFNSMVPRHVRISLGGRPAEYAAAFRALDVPVLVTQGDRDQLIRMDMARWIAATVPGARLSAYEGIGHSPFWEAPERFSAELAALSAAARR